MTISRSARAAFTTGIVLCSVVPALSGLSPSAASAAQYPGPPPPVPALPTDTGGPPPAAVSSTGTALGSPTESAPVSQAPQSPPVASTPAVSPSPATTTPTNTTSGSTTPAATIVHKLTLKKTHAGTCQSKRHRHSKVAKRCLPSRVRRHHGKSASAADTGIIGTAYAPSTTCNGPLDAWTVPNYQPGLISIAPDATPGSDFSAQYISTSLWFYVNGQWFQGNWSTALVSQPDPNIVTVGGSFGAPWLLEAQLGELGYVYVASEYYWYSGVGNTPGQWYGPEWGQPASYTQYWDNDASQQSGACYIG